NTCRFNQTGDLINTDPLLDALAGNGGATQTHALLPGSPAIDAGDPAGCTDASGAALLNDQRGQERTQDGDGNGTATCDIGAYEPPAIVYRNDFQGATGAEWSNSTTSTTPNGTRRFLGPFGNDPVSLTLTGLPAHTGLALLTDLLVIGGWTGNS